jgi:hypothetical protein
MNLTAALTEENEEIVDAVTEPEVMSAVGPVLSLVAVKPSFKEFVAVVDDRIATAKGITVQDEKSQKLAVALVGEAKCFIKEIDARKKALDEYKKAKGFLDSLNSFAKELTEKFETIVKLADPKVKQYMAKVELERKQQEAAAKKAAKDLQDAIDAEVAAANKKAADEAAQKAADEAKAAGAGAEEIEAAKTAAVTEAAKNEITAPQVIQQSFPISNKITRTDTGVSAFAKKPWVFEITNEADIPREYCTPDNKKIRDAIKMGIREITGCRIFEDTQVNYKS